MAGSTAPPACSAVTCDAVSMPGQSSIDTGPVGLGWPPPSPSPLPPSSPNEPLLEPLEPPLEPPSSPPANWLFLELPQLANTKTTAAVVHHARALMRGSLRGG